MAKKIVARKATTEDDRWMGPYRRELGNGKPLSREQEIELFKRLHDGDETAISPIVTANLRFVVTVACQYMGMGLSVNQLISEGNWGLIEAVKRFDEARGFKFITYAVWWIRQAILKALAEAPSVRHRPASRLNDLQRIENALKKLQHQKGREVDLGEVGEELGLSQERISNALELLRADVSLDVPVYEGDDKELADYVVSNDVSPETVMIANERDEFVRSLIAAGLSRERLDSRELQILTMYFGLDGEKPLTLEEIGAALGITRERVRQIRERVLTKLRKMCSELRRRNFDPHEHLDPDREFVDSTAP